MMMEAVSSDVPSQHGSSTSRSRDGASDYKYRLKTVNFVSSGSRGCTVGGGACAIEDQCCGGRGGQYNTSLENEEMKVGGIHVCSPVYD